MAITPGDTIHVTDARGEQLVMRALSAPTAGKDFTIVWVCTEEDWRAAGEQVDQVLGRVPWPLHAVAEPAAI